MIVLISKDSINSCHTKSALTKIDTFTFKMLESIDSDYITFILGFISSVVINDFYGIFNFTVKENEITFWFMLIECIILASVTVSLLCFAIEFSKMQRILSPHKTVEARRNYFQDKMIGTKTKRFFKRFLTICILSAIALLLNVIKFILLNT